MVPPCGVGVYEAVGNDKNRGVKLMEGVFRLTLEDSTGKMTEVRITNSYIEHICKNEKSVKESFGAIVLNLFERLGEMEDW